MRESTGIKEKTGTPRARSTCSGVETVSSMYSRKNAAPTPTASPTRTPIARFKTLRGFTGCVGTIAAYVVGGGGGLSSAVTGETLLRDRVAGNIALAGEEQLRNATYTQNITVTLPANMRFYVVLQKGTVSVSPPVSTVADAPVSRTQTELPTVQEIRELMDLRREINRMYQESNGGPGGPPQ